MAGHDKIYAVTAAVVTAAVLVARWRATARHRGRRRYDTAGHTAWRRTGSETAWSDTRRGSVSDAGYNHLSATDPRTQPAVHQAEELLEQYWTQLRPLYPSEEEYPER